MKKQNRYCTTITKLWTSKEPVHTFFLCNTLKWQHTLMYLPDSSFNTQFVVAWWLKIKVDCMEYLNLLPITHLWSPTNIWVSTHVFKNPVMFTSTPHVLVSRAIAFVILPSIIFVLGFVTIYSSIFFVYN